MNCGLGNLATLKAHILPATMQADAQFDQTLQDIGRGVKGMFDLFCNRLLDYRENVTEVFKGDRNHWYLTRYPYDQLLKIEMRYFQTDNWTPITSEPVATIPESGLLDFGYTLGRSPLQVRVTYSGGYWFQMLEPSDAAYQVCNSQDDPGYPGALPAAIQASSPAGNPPFPEPYKFLLPPDLRLAWLMQSKLIFQSKDPLGGGLVDKPNAQDSLASLELSPHVKQILKAHVRMNLS